MRRELWHSALCLVDSKPSTLAANQQFIHAGLSVRYSARVHTQAYMCVCVHGMHMLACVCMHACVCTHVLTHTLRSSSQEDGSIILLSQPRSLRHREVPQCVQGCFAGKLVTRFLSPDRLTLQFCS